LKLWLWIQLGLSKFEKNRRPRFQRLYINPSIGRHPLLERAETALDTPSNSHIVPPGNCYPLHPSSSSYGSSHFFVENCTLVDAFQVRGRPHSSSPWNSLAGQRADSLFSLSSSRWYRLWRSDSEIPCLSKRLIGESS
jgi:hypothetical protein